MASHPAMNNGMNIDVTPVYPACFGTANEIVVAATDNRDAKAGFSNYGAASVHLVAPGVNVLSTIIGNQYDYFSGTSMATPHVSGAAALCAAAILRVAKKPSEAPNTTESARQTTTRVMVSSAEEAQPM